MTMLMRLSVIFLVAAACCPLSAVAQPVAAEAAQADGVSQELEQEIADYLEEVGRVMRANDIEAMGELVDVAGILDYAYEQDVIPPVFEDESELLIALMTPEAGAIFAEPNSGYGFSTFKIWQIVEDDGVYVVSATQSDDAGYIQRIRWWLKPSPETGFLICDVELVEAAMRMSTMWGLGFLSVDQENAALVEDVECIVDAMDMWAELDFESMRTTLREVDKEVLPDTLVRICWLMEGVASINLYEDEGLSLLLVLQATLGDGLISPLAFAHLAEAYSHNAQLDEALSAVDRYEEHFGPDAICMSLRGYAYEALGDGDRAWEYYLAGLDLAPQDGWALYGIASFTTDARVDEFNHRYAQLEDTEFWFQIMLQAAEEDQDIDGLKRITAAHRLVFPDDPMLDDADDIMLELQGE